MKKLVSFICSLSLAASAFVYPVSANAIYTEMDKNTSAYQEMIRGFSKIENFHVFDWACEKGFSEVYVNDTGTIFIGLSKIEDPMAALNLSDGVDAEAVNKALQEHFNEDYSISHRACGKYLYQVSRCAYGTDFIYNVPLSMEEAKEVSAFLKEKGLVRDFVYMTERCSVAEFYTHSSDILVYRIDSKEELDELKKYIADNNLDYYVDILGEETDSSISYGDMFACLISENESTVSDKISMAEKIYEDTGLGICAISPASLKQEPSSVIDLFNSAEDFGLDINEITAKDWDTVFVVINGYCYDNIKGNPLIYFEDDSIAEICGSTTDYKNNTTELRIYVKKSGSTVLHVETPDGKSDTCKITVVEKYPATPPATPELSAEKLSEVRAALEKYISENNTEAEVVIDDKYGLNDKLIIAEIPYEAGGDAYRKSMLDVIEAKQYIAETYGAEYGNAVTCCPSDLYEVREKVAEYIAENNLEEKGIVCSEFSKYPNEFGRVVVEEIDSYDYQSLMDLFAYIKENVIGDYRYYICTVPVQNGIPITTALCDTVITTTTTTAVPTTTTADNRYGDVNCDGEVSLADAIFILQSISNPDRYKLSEQGKRNADVDGTEGVTANDALSIQKYQVHLIDDLPEKK